MSDSDSNSESDDYYLDDNDPEFIEFKENTKLWLNLDDDITTLTNAIKDRKNKKKQITPKLLDFMDHHNINDLNTENGHLKCQKTLRTKPVSKKLLISRLGDFFRNTNKGEKAVDFVYSNREKTEISNLKRIYPKKK